MRPIDDRLQKAFGTKDIVYSRWIDDIVISASYSLRTFIPFVSRILKDSGLSIHTIGRKKPVQFGPGEQALVTGLTCRGRVAVPQNYIETIKSELRMARRFTDGHSRFPPPYCRESYWGVLQYISRFNKGQAKDLFWLFNRVKWEKFRSLELPSRKPRLRDQQT